MRRRRRKKMLISFKEKGEIQSIHNVNDTTPPPLTDVATFGFFKTSTRKKKQNRGKRMKIKVISMILPIRGFFMSITFFIAL